MDKELIKMCDCPEIQKKWVNREYSSASPEDKFRAKQIHLWFQGQDRTAYDVPPLYFKDAIYIPRIEDVLEWLTMGGLRSTARAYEEVLNYIGIGGLWDTPVIISAIKCFMAWKHNKTWDGEKWT